jgi:hypothetical protein
VLALDSDLPPDPDLLSTAAGRAVDLIDMPLAVRLASAAVAAGAGLATRLQLGYALGWMGRGVEAEAVFAEASRLARTDADRAQVAIPRAAGLFFPLARPDEAQAVVSAAQQRVRDGTTAGELRAVRALFDAFLARSGAAADAASEILADPRSSTGAVALAGWAMVTASAGRGRLAGLEDCVRRAYAAARTFPTGHVRSGIAEGWVRALLLAGLITDAEAAVPAYAEQVDGLAGPAQGFVLRLEGCIARERGRVATAARRFTEFTSRWGTADPAGHVLLVAPLVMAGDAPSARAALTVAAAHRHPGFVHVEPELVLAQAWVAAAEGVLSEGVSHAREAADVAAAQGQPAVEVVALHTAVQFGDRTVATRLAELAGLVDGPRAPAAAAHAAALAGKTSRPCWPCPSGSSGWGRCCRPRTPPRRRRRRRPGRVCAGRPPRRRPGRSTSRGPARRRTPRPSLRSPCRCR